MIVFVHLLNDSSGSPRVLLSTIATLTNAGEEAKLFIGADGNGCLTHCGLPITRYFYKRTGYRVATMFTYLFSQVVLFFKLLRDRSISPQAIIYVNTLLPFGAALYGKLTGRKVIYHVHEISITPVSLKYLLNGVARLTSALNIYVSDAHMQAMSILGVSAVRVYNSLDINFVNRAASLAYVHRNGGCFNILMVSSLRDYKGIPELLALASALVGQPEIRFDLVLNDDLTTINSYFAIKTLPANLKLHPRTSDTTAFYSKASLVLNLSRVDQWIETFGMTILEAMAFGIPVIVPPLGGPSELVVDGVEGFCVDSRDHKLLLSRVIQLYCEESLCIRMSQSGRIRAAKFSIANYDEEVMNAINQIRRENI
jgi:glycosyltransferase involved in cell wall biosynthesis